MINFHQKNPIGIAWGNFIQGYTIYLHKCESKLKYITAVDLKTTLDPQR